MAALPRRAVLDASAVLAWILDENGRTVIEKILPVGVISAADMTEVLYKTVEVSGAPGAEGTLLNELMTTGLEVEPNTVDDCVRAAELIAQSRSGQAGSLSLGDALCLAVGERLGLPIVGGDQVWETLTLQTTYRPFR